MMKWKLQPINSKEIVNVTHATNKSEAEYIFAKIKKYAPKRFFKII